MLTIFLPENDVESNMMHWDDFVRKSVELTRSEHVVNIEGIGFKNGELH